MKRSDCTTWAILVLLIGLVVGVVGEGVYFHTGREYMQMLRFEGVVGLITFVVFMVVLFFGDALKNLINRFRRNKSD